MAAPASSGKVARLHIPSITKVQIASYNTNLQGNNGLPQDLVSWLKPTLGASHDDDPPDILAVGFQELLPLHLGLIGLSRHVVSTRDQHILNAVEAHHGTPYALVAKSVNVGVALLVYVRDAGIGRRVKKESVQTSWTGCGPLFMGNKGAVGVRFTVTGRTPGEADETFTFVNVHLTAHPQNLEKRISDYRHIVGTLLFPPPKPWSFSFGPSHSSSMYATTHLFVSGDLNFRLVGSSSLTTSDVGSQVQSLPGRKRLAERDELSIERAKGTVAHGLFEGDFTAFKPTYKYDLDTEAEYSDKRIPAWTDRILYRTCTDVDSSSITPLLYTSVPSYVSSDHKPIVAILSVPSPSPTDIVHLPQTHQLATFPNTYRYAGKVSAWVIGWVWCILKVIGFGRTTVGVGNVVAGAGVLAWWKWIAAV